MTTAHNANKPEPINIIYAKESIVIYQALDEALCKEVIKLFDSANDKQRGKIGRHQDLAYEQQIKNSWDMEIRNDGIWQDIFQKIHTKTNSCITHYLGQSPVLKDFPLQLTGYKIQMYPKNEGYFRWHADSVGKSARDRVAAMVLYLNDVERGGETEFFHQGLKVTPKAGNLVMFPTGWNYMHCGHTAESNDKYIISTFVKIND